MDPSDRTQMKFITIGNDRVPCIGFGTYRLTGRDCREAVSSALDIGYRHIDTAMAYGNEEEVGAAITDSDLSRDKLFVTTKVKGYAEYLEYDSLIEKVEKSLDRLALSRIDLLLIHWWNPSVDIEEPITAMNQLQDEGKVRNIGVSNFSKKQLEAAISVSNTPIVTNQVEYHPYRNLDEMLSYCQNNDIILTAYSPLAEGLVVSDRTLSEIGEKYGKSPSQVVLRWLIQQPGVAAIPKARKRVHQLENINIFDFELTEQEIKTIANIDGPLLYRLNSEGGIVYRFRSWAGPIYQSAISKIPV